MLNETELVKRAAHFEREYRRIEPYRRRNLTSNLELREEYKVCLVETYNALIDLVDPKNIPEEEKSDILLKFTGYLAKVREAFKLLKLNYKFKKGDTSLFRLN